MDGNRAASAAASTDDRGVPLPDDREALVRELQATREALLDKWLASVDHGSAELAEIKASTSWRVTKPLREVRRIQIIVAAEGLPATLRLAMGKVRRKLGSSP